MSFRVVPRTVVAAVLFLACSGVARATFLQISARAGCPGFSGSNNWQATGVTVPAVGASMTLGVEGTITNSSGGPNVPPEGSAPAPAGGGFCAPALAPHSAIGCIGACTSGGGTVFQIGRGSTGIPAPAAGPLYLGVNDDLYVDNNGDFGAAVGIGAGVMQAYQVQGVSSGSGWTFELRNPGAGPSGPYNFSNPGLPVGSPPGAFSTAFAAAINAVGLPNVTATGGGPILRITAPTAFQLYLSPPGGPGPPVTLVGPGVGPVTFNPTIEWMEDSAAVPATGPWALAILVSAIALAVIFLLRSRGALAG